MRPRNIEVSTHLGECEVVATVRYYPAFPGSWYRRNGDPGDPPEPSEVEVIAIKYMDGAKMEGRDFDHHAEQLAQDENFLEKCDEVAMEDRE